MNAIKERFLCCLIGAGLCVVAAILFAWNAIWHVVIPFAAVAGLLILFSIRLAERCQSARLIYENPILRVDMASVSEPGNATESAVTVVVSGFGILLDGKPYKFGHGGVQLTAITVDRESITLSFGGEEKSYSVRLLHGIADKAEVDALTKRLKYETGVVANVSGW